MLTSELRQKHTEGSRALSETLETQQRIRFPFIVTGNEYRISSDTNSNSICPESVKKSDTIAYGDSSSKAMLFAFSDITGMMRMNWLPRCVSFNRASFNQKVFQPSAIESQREKLPKSCLWILFERDNIKSHTSQSILKIIKELHFKHCSFAFQT
jgi:hypothetical protein